MIINERDRTMRMKTNRPQHGPMMTVAGVRVTEMMNTMCLKL